MKSASNKAFTLIEVLMVIAIILILTAMATVALFNAYGIAKHARTEAQVARIHAYLGPAWESYRTRRAALPVGTARQRVDAIREIQRMELPDRITDVRDDPVTPGLVRTALSRAYQRKAKATWTAQYQGAECLYMILSMPKEDGEIPLTYFSEKEIGDIDRDEMPEILDGWGRPIEFLRWPFGFVSPIQKDDGDPFDPNRVYANQKYIFPLVYSAGQDGLYGVYSDIITAGGGGDPSDALGGQHYRASATTPPNDPYYTSPDGVRIGDMKATGFKDNVFSHYEHSIEDDEP